MSSANEIIDYPEIKSYEGGPVPTFLKIVYVGFAIFAPAYFFLYFSGDGSQLVQTFNQLCGGH